MDSLAKQNHPRHQPSEPRSDCGDMAINAEKGQCRLVTSSSTSIVGHLAQFSALCGIGQQEESIP
jgi:hypothetical protein